MGCNPASVNSKLDTLQQGFFWPFWEILGTNEIGKKLCDFGKKKRRFWEKIVVFNKIGKVNLLDLDFSANRECSRSIGNFFSQLGKNLVPETGPSFVERKSPVQLGHHAPLWEIDGEIVT